MRAEAVLREHLSLCEETQTLMLEENKFLRSGRVDFAQEHFDKKEGLLERLGESVRSLKALNAQKSAIGLQSEALLQAAQKKLMKVIMLDKENEQLFLKAGYDKKSSLANSAASSNSVKSAYGQNR